MQTITVNRNTLETLVDAASQAAQHPALVPLRDAVAGMQLEIDRADLDAACSRASALDYYDGPVVNLHLLQAECSGWDETPTPQGRRAIVVAITLSLCVGAALLAWTMWATTPVECRGSGELPAHCVDR